ncbi:hypothetical protein JTE90_026500 [Oedothorax gibbosus]|uniref:Uncharacterized protein n=1 Tax=Oedothorax gibbosus TaxID=931172 RepID=A0AAV6VS74_9ARAC|nr:hypothetical protein JTE90_026500 [Oedothorax gibbosus]
MSFGSFSKKRAAMMGVHLRSPSSSIMKAELFPRWINDFPCHASPKERLRAPQNQSLEPMKGNVSSKKRGELIDPIKQSSFTMVGRLK